MKLFGKKRQGKEFLLLALLFHIYNHNHIARNIKNIPYELLSVELKWSENKLLSVYNTAVRKDYLVNTNDDPLLTKEGIEYVKKSYFNYFKVVL